MLPANGERERRRDHADLPFVIAAGIFIARSEIKPALAIEPVDDGFLVAPLGGATVDARPRRPAFGRCAVAQSCTLGPCEGGRHAKQAEHEKAATRARP
jgi:hypothetical protein